MNINLNVSLWPDSIMDRSGNNAGCPSLTPYLLKDEQSPVMIVCPGGGYGMRAEHEGEPVARWLNRIGVSAVVLNYRVAPYRHPIPMNDALRAIRLVRHHADDWGIDATRVGILGFSAGGHLASTVGTHYELGNPCKEDPIDRESGRPDVMVLCYPVISMGAYTHEGSRSCLLGDRQNDQGMIELLSNEKQITDHTPPTFLWHTVDDAAVPVENVIMFAEGLRRNSIPFDLHLFESGEHGLGLADNHNEAGLWPTLCEMWLRRRRFII